MYDTSPYPIFFAFISGAKIGRWLEKGGGEGGGGALRASEPLPFQRCYPFFYDRSFNCFSYAKVKKLLPALPVI